MASPVMLLGAPGGLINNVSVTHGTNTGVFVDISTVWEGRITCQMDTGATPPTLPTVFTAYPIYGNATPITVSSYTSSTVLAVSSVAGMHVGQKIALQQATGSKLGEVATISGISTNTLTLSTLANVYAAGDAVYLIAQSAVAVAEPSGSNSAWVASTDYSYQMTLGTGQYFLAAANTDTAQNVTVTASLDEVQKYQ